ncbi:MAG: putative ATP-grasp-modified RiPP [Pseudonocardiaceae bacterium]
MSVTALSSGDPLFRTGDQFPMGRPFGLIEPVSAAPSRPELRPFGLSFATAAAVPVDVSGLRYDPARQLGVIEAGGKHSTGPTNTRTSDGHKSMDSDTDHTED